MSTDPLSRKETRGLITRLLAAIEELAGPPIEGERDELREHAARWLKAEDEAPFFSQPPNPLRPLAQSIQGPRLQADQLNFRADPIDDPDETGYAIGTLYINGVMHHLHAIRLHETKDGVVEGHPDNGPTTASRLEDWWTCDPEARFDTVQIPGLEGDYAVFMSPRDR